MIPGLGHAFNQVTNILSGKPKKLTKTSTTTGGSALGEEYGTYGMDQYKGMMNPTAYTGNVPGAQGPNAAQNQQYNMLTGMYSGYGAPDGYQNMYQNLSGVNPQTITAMDRSGGPKPGYTSPYQKEMLAGVDQDMKNAMQMAANTESSMTGDYMGTNVGGPSAARSRNKLWGEQGDIGLQAAKMKSGIRDTGFRNAMGWQREDARDRAADITAMNRDKLGFGAMNMNAASNDMNNQMNMANLFGNYGRNWQNQQNMADQFGYNEFNRMQNWKPKMMNQYMSGVNATPWQTTSTNTATGQGKSDLNNLIGMGIGLGGAALGGGFFNPTG